MLDVARQIKDRGANRVFVCAAFGLFTDGLEKFDEYHEKGYISKVITTIWSTSHQNCSPALITRKPI